MPDNDAYSRHVARKEKRRLKGRRKKGESPFFGLGLFGMVGWSVAVPTLIGAFVGAWIDISHPGQYSWSLMLVCAGLVLGCFNAWYWVDRERNAIMKDMQDENDMQNKDDMQDKNDA